MQAIVAMYQTRHINNLRLYQFPALSETNHAVFSRVGGISPAPWQGLNLSQAVGDSAENVTRNFEAACHVLALDVKQTAFSHLVHETQVADVLDVKTGSHFGQADALITQTPGITLTMRFADCTPLLLYDPQTRAVGLAHAGWRGTVQNMMGAVIKAMQQQFYSQPEDMTVVIGPAIGPCCYEVKTDVITAAAPLLKLKQADRFLVHREGRRYLNLWAINHYQAQQAGVKNIVQSELCTACHTNDFYSHRAEQGQTGRFGVFLGVPDDR